MNRLGIRLKSWGDYKEALVYCTTALQIRRAALGAKHLDVGETYNNLGSIHDSQGQSEKALEYYNLSLQIRCEVTESGAQPPLLFS